MNQTVQVIGESILKVAPDTIEFFITLETRSENYQELLRKNQEQLEKLTESFVNYDFDEPNLRLISYEIFPLYKTVENKSVFDTFQSIQRFNFQIDNNNELLGRVLTAIDESKVPVTFSMNYTINDKSKWEKELLTSAVNEAYQEATILTEAVGKKVGTAIAIVSLDEQNTFRSQTMFTANAISTNYNPMDIELRQRVNVTWEII